MKDGRGRGEHAKQSDVPSSVRRKRFYGKRKEQKKYYDECVVGVKSKIGPLLKKKKEERERERRTAETFEETTLECTEIGQTPAIRWCQNMKFK